MATSTAFEWLCDELETKTTLDRLEARGTVRIALKQAGLEATSATAAQIAVVLTRILPEELGKPLRPPAARENLVGHRGILARNQELGIGNSDFGFRISDFPLNKSHESLVLTER